MSNKLQDQDRHELRVIADREMPRRVRRATGAGFVAISTLLGTVVGCSQQPSAALGPAQRVFEAQYCFGGAMIGAAMGVVAALWWRRCRFGLLFLFELLLVFAFLGLLGRNLMMAQEEFNARETRALQSLSTP